MIKKIKKEQDLELEKIDNTLKINDIDINGIIRDGVNWSTRTIYFNNASPEDSGNPNTNYSTEINEYSSERLIRYINIMNSLNDLPISINMNSEGGDIISTLGIVDCILSSRSPIFFLGYGSISSAAIIIMMVCDLRILTPNAYLIAHGNIYGDDSGSSYAKIQQALYCANYLKNKMIEIQTQNSKMDPEFWKIIENGEFLLTAEEALAIGICDGIARHRDRAEMRKDYREFAAGQMPEEELKNIRNKLLQRIKNT